MADVRLGGSFYSSSGGLLSGDVVLGSGVDILVTSGLSNIATQTNPANNIYAIHGTFTTLSGSSPIQLLSPVIDASGNSLSPVTVFSEVVSLPSSGSNVRNITLSKNALSFLSCFVHYNVSGANVSISPLLLAEKSGTLYMHANSNIYEIDSQTRSIYPVITGSSSISANGMDVDDNGNILYVQSNSVYRITSSGTEIIVNADGTGGYNGDNIPATGAHLTNPANIRFKNGNLYIADLNNQRVRAVDSSGIITTLAGNGNGGTWDGVTAPATGIAWGNPTTVDLDEDGNIYIGQNIFGGSRIAKVDISGIATLYAGNGGDVYNGENIAATGAGLGSLTALRFYQNNLYLMDNQLFRMRRIDSSGVIHNVAGNGSQACAADSVVATGSSIGVVNNILQSNSIVPINDEISFIESNCGRIRQVVSGNMVTYLGKNGVLQNTFGEYIFDTTYAPPSQVELAKFQNVISNGVITHSGNVLGLDVTKIAASNYPSSGIDSILVTYLTNE